MSITTVGPNLVHYEALGRGQPLIFIHGWFGSWRYWWPAMQALSTHHRTFALDLWGFGDSTKASDKYSLSDNVTLLEEFVERLGIAAPAVLVGHGIGAAVALRYTLRHPQKVVRLATVAFPIQGKHLNSHLFEGAEATATLNRVAGKGNRFPEIELELHKTDPAAIEALAAEVKEGDFAPELAQLSCPLLLLFGAQDSLVEHPNGASATLLAGSANRAAIILESCNHFPMLEETAKFNRLILDFIKANNLDDLAPKEYWQRRTH